MDSDVDSRERPFARAFRELCAEKKLSVGDIVAHSHGMGVKLGKTTVVELWSGVTWVPSERVLEALPKVMGLDKDQTERLIRAAEDGEDARAAASSSKAATEDTAGDDQQQSTGSTSRVPIWIRRAPTWVWIALAGLLVIAAGIFIATRSGDDPPPSPTPSPACVSPRHPLAQDPASPGRGRWQAMVVNTWSSSRCEDIGVRPRVDPLEGKQTWPGYHIGDAVIVTCYRKDGSQIVDKDTQEVSTIWYRLSDGRWLSALFLQVEGKPATQPPEAMPVCTK